MSIKKLAAIGIVLLIAAAGAAYPLLSPSADMETATPDSAPVSTPDAPPIPAPESAPASDVAAAPAQVSEQASEIDVEKALAERGLGDPNAPVVVKEFASLSCPHCAAFHKSNYEKLKTDYIDTGKVYFIYNDFPLNAPALDGAMVARCLPESSYFAFIKLLFDTQEQWAFQQDHKQALRQNAKLAGADDALLDKCLASTALKEGLVARMKEMGEKYKIESTPSFVLNEKETISGEQTYESFSGRIDALLAETGGNGKQAE